MSTYLTPKVMRIEPVADSPAYNSKTLCTYTRVVPGVHAVRPKQQRPVQLTGIHETKPDLRC